MRINKQDAHEYYKNNIHKMKEYMEGKQIMGVQMTPIPVIKKYEKGEPIIIKSFDPNNTTDHKNFFYYPDKHYVDFHIIHGPKTNIIPIDIDPNGVPEHKVKAVTKVVKNAISKLTNGNVEVFHTGGRGYHVIGKLEKEIDTRLARKIVDTHLKPIVNTFSFTVFGRPPRRGEIRIDTSTFHPGGSIRVPYSINYKTGKPSRKVDL